MFRFDPHACSFSAGKLKQLLVFGCYSPLADALGAVGCLLTFLLLAPACCHGGQYVSVNNLA